MKKISVFILLLTLAACNGGSEVKPEGGPKKVVKASAGSTPDWVVMQKKSSSYVYFVGIGSGETELKKVRDKAVDDAVGQLVEYIGFRVTAKTEKTTEYTDTDDASTFSETIKDSLEGKGTAKVSVDIEDFYYEQYSDNSLMMYVLLKLPKDWVEQERARLKRLAQEQRQQSIDLLAKAKKLKDAGELSMALDETLAAYFISEKAVENSDLYDQSKNLILSILQGMSFKLLNSPKYAYTEGGSEPIQVGVYSFGSTHPVGGLPVSAEVKDEVATTRSASGFNTDKKGEVTLETARILKKSENKLTMNISFSLSKMEKIAALDKEFYQEILKIQKDQGLSLDMEIGSIDKLTPTVIVIVHVMKTTQGFVKPAFRPDLYQRFGGALAEKGYNIISADIPASILKEGSQEVDLKKQVVDYLKKNYPQSKRMAYGIEVITPAGKDVALENTYSVQVDVTMSIVDLSTLKVEKSANARGGLWGNTMKQAIQMAEKKAYKKLFVKLAEF